MERFRRLLVNFDDDVAGGPGGDDDDDDGEVQVSASDSTPIVGLIFSRRRSRARMSQSLETAVTLGRRR
jgi:hypothetical protein